MKNPNLKLIKPTAAIILLGCTLLLIHFFTISKNGYCRAAGRILTDDERINVAIAYIIERYPPPAELTKHHPMALTEMLTPPSNPVKYINTKDFIAKNTGCCKIVPNISKEGHPRTWPEKSTGVIYGFAIINYDVIFVDKNGERRILRKTEQLPISNCGKPQIWWSLPDSSWIDVIYHFFRD